MRVSQINFKSFLAYTSFVFNYGLKLSFKIILYEFKYRNYYNDNTSNHIPNNKLDVKNYDTKKITGYSPSYYYYLYLIKLFFEKKSVNFDNIYDVGFGTGRVLYFCQFLANNIYGFEISKRLFDIGTIKLNKVINKNKKVELLFINALEFSKYKDNSIIFIFDPFTKSNDLETILRNISNLKNSYLVYANPRFRKNVKLRFKEVFCEKSQNFRGLSIFQI